MYGNMTDEDFVELIFTSEDRLGLDYIQEAQKRRSAIVPLMSAVLGKERHYCINGKGFWGAIHAVHILGILGDPTSLEALSTADKFSKIYEIDWIWEALPECYLRLGKEVIPKLMSRIDSMRSVDPLLIAEYIVGLWNFWEAYPEERQAIEDFMLRVLNNAETDPATRADLICDFAQLGRHDLESLFEGFFERGEVDLQTLTREDMEYFFKRAPEAPVYHYDLEGFYSKEEIEARQVRWKEEAEQEDEEPDEGTIEDFILKNMGKIPRNDPCPCGSGKKFKKCHLPWAEQQRLLEREEDTIEQEQLGIGYAIQQERRAETDLRRFLTRKGQTGLFAELKSKVLEAVKAPTDEFASRGIFSYFEPLLSKLKLNDKRETEAFIAMLMEYFNAMSQQFLGHPRSEKQLH